MRLYRPTYTRGGKTRTSQTWWLDFTHEGRRLRLAGLTSKRATEALAARVGDLLAVRQSGDSLPADLLRWLEQIPSAFRAKLAEVGLIDKDRAGGLRPLVETDRSGQVIGGHLADFLADAEARGASAKHRNLLAQRCRDTLAAAGCLWPRDLSADRVQGAIAAMGTPTDDRPDGLSRQSQKHYVRAVKQFSRWLYVQRRTAEDMLLSMKTYNPETDKRRERRGFTPEEMAALLAYTAQAPERYGMSGPARAAAYRLAFTTGFRRNEIRTLTAGSFDLAGEPPTVTVEAAYSKHRRQDVQPLPADVADALAGHLADADPDRPFALPDKTAKMLRQDMQEARKARQVEDADFLMPRDSRGLVLDFHSFRHGFVTAICRAEVSPRVMMELARHSDPRLTMKRYSRVAVAESAKALDALPKLPGAGPAEAPGQAGALAKSFAKCCALATTLTDFRGLKADSAQGEKKAQEQERQGLTRAG
jgi:integrase